MKHFAAPAAAATLRRWAILALLPAVLPLLLPQPRAALAHEYWLDPHRPIATLPARLRADARVGQFFNGDALPWLPEAVAEAGIIDARGRRANARIIGDMPMFDTAARTPGAQILFLRTKPESLVWETWEKFLAFLEEKKLHAVADRHRRRGLPDSGFTEHYMRHAKALLWRDAARDDEERQAPSERRTATTVDRVIGLPLELVLLDNPFALPAAEGGNILRVRLLWRGRPLANTDVQVFSRPAGQRGHEARPRHFTTDAQGIVQVPAQAGRDYLVNAVHMLPLGADAAAGTSTGKQAPATKEPQEDGGNANANGANAVWISHWASLTFTTRHFVNGR